MSTEGAATSTAKAYSYIYTCIILHYTYIVYIHYVCISVKRAFVSTKNQYFNYAMASVALHKSSCMHFVKERLYESQWTISSGTSFPTCNRRCQTHATVIRVVTKFVETSAPLQTKGFSKVECTVALHQCIHAFAVALWLEWYRILYVWAYCMSVVPCFALCQSQLCFFTDRPRHMVVIELPSDQRVCFW